MVFQWRWLERAEPSLNGWPTVLNIGSADDPLEFGSRAVHFDIDNWAAVHEHFVQGDAHKLPFDDQCFDTVIMGDIHEHAFDPFRITQEGARVAKRYLVMTIFEEWKLPGPGRWIEEGRANSEKESQKLGYLGREDYQRQVYPERIGVPDDEIPHLIHIWQFTDEHIQRMLDETVAIGFAIVEAAKAYEATHEGHSWYNWLICMERVRK